MAKIPVMNNMEVPEFQREHNFDFIIHNIMKEASAVQEIREVKQMFIKEIASRRIFSTLNTIADLLNILIIRDVINEHEVTVLEKICVLLKLDKALSDVQAYNKTINGRGSCPICTENIEASSEVSDSGTNSSRNMLYTQVARVIGIKWKQLARTMGTNEDKILQAQASSPNLQEQALKFLKIFYMDKDETSATNLLLTALRRLKFNKLADELGRRDI
ncbi:uncharacterized protein LOC136043096 isoform X2 [Artemia franciscana]|uniref:uncharacterized protein LOC136043096 isoform X2 n=1 Tax=Artemia franciscana TaxID=6661 RepID=UPI0032DA7E0B